MKIVAVRMRNTLETYDRVVGQRDEGGYLIGTKEKDMED